MTTKVKYYNNIGSLTGNSIATLLWAQCLQSVVENALMIPNCLSKAIMMNNKEKLTKYIH
jgi:hypothetical protein